MRLTRLLAAAGVLLVTTLVAAAPAAAHDELVNATPRAGSTVERLPAEVRLAFDQRVLADLSVVRVTGPGGRVLSSGPPTVVGTIVTQRTAGAAPAGAYRLAYRVVSADGHPVAGGWGFTVATAGTVATAVTAGSDAAGRPGLPDGPALLALVVVAVAAAGSLALRARVLRRARADDADGLADADEPAGTHDLTGELPAHR